MSKGSVRRPQQVSREEYERRWARAFGHKVTAEYPGAEAFEDWDFGPAAKRLADLIDGEILKEYKRTWVND